MAFLLTVSALSQSGQMSESGFYHAECHRFGLDLLTIMNFDNIIRDENRYVQLEWFNLN